MANPEHLEILKQGAKAWNEWRVKHPEIRADLIYADLTGANLTDADLTDADLSSADLIDANLTGADLWNAHLFAVDLIDADLSSSELRYANFNQTRLKGTKFNDAHIGSGAFAGTDLSEAVGLETVGHVRLLLLELTRFIYQAGRFQRFSYAAAALLIGR